MVTAAIVIQGAQALTVFIVAIVAARIAYHQMVTARVKLQLDLFDRRYIVYQAVRDFWVKIVQSSQPTHDDMREFNIGVRDAQFLFNVNVINYIAEFRGCAAKLIATTNVLKSPHLSDDERGETNEKHDELFDWIYEQDDKIAGLFSSYMKFDQLKTPTFFNLLP